MLTPRTDGLGIQEAVSAVGPTRCSEKGLVRIKDTLLWAGGRRGDSNACLQLLKAVFTVWMDSWDHGGLRLLS